MILHYNGLEIETSPLVYEPSEDTFLVASILEREVDEKDTVLDMGTGTGILALIAARKAKRVVGVDKNPHAVELALRNRNRNKIANATFMVSDLFEKIEGEYTLIVFNPPYLPHSRDEDTGTPIDLSWDGGPDGRQVINRFLEELPEHLSRGGRVLLLESTLSRPEETTKKLVAMGLSSTIVARQKLSWEELVVHRITHRITGEPLKKEIPFGSQTQHNI